MTSNSVAPETAIQGPKKTFEGARMWPGIPLYAVLLINNALWKGLNEFQLSSDESFRTTLVFVLFW